MKARKILAVSLTAAMTLALAACGGSSSDKESSSKDSSDKVYKIGICQQLEHAALDEATKGFEEACEEKFGKDKVKFDLQNGLNYLVLAMLPLIFRMPRASRQTAQPS